MAHTLVVEGGLLANRPWIVHNVENIGDRDFAPLDKRDSGLCRFVLGSTQRNPLKDFVFFDDLRQQRNRLSLDLHRPCKQGSREWRKAKVAAAVRVQESEIVEIPLPAIDHDGETMQETIVRVKRPTSFNERLLVEFEAATLRYIRLAILAKGKREAPRSRPMRIETGDVRVRWVQGRDAYLAKRPNGKYKHFRLHGECEDADLQARKKARASKWADGDSDVSGSDGNPDGAEQEGCCQDEAHEDEEDDANGEA